MAETFLDISISKDVLVVNTLALESTWDFFSAIIKQLLTTYLTVLTLNLETSMESFEANQDEV